jgi:hypothetical protein
MVCHPVETLGPTVRRGVVATHAQAAAEQNHQRKSPAVVFYFQHGMNLLFSNSRELEKIKILHPFAVAELLN